MKTYLIVTNDELEHPVKEIVGCKGVAEFLEMKMETLKKYIMYGFPKKHKYKVVIIKEMQYDTEEKRKERLHFYNKRWSMNNDRKEYMREYARYKRKLERMTAKQVEAV